jgi:omega-amidase
MADLHVTLIQSDISWEDPVKNLGHFGKLIDTIPTHTDLIVLPEMFNTGFSINPNKCAESVDGPAVDFLREKSSANNCMIMASVLTDEEGSYYNRLICMQPDGNYHQYDKRHLFRLSNEYKIMKRGREKVIVRWKGWNILPLVCYDLRFPLWSRNKWKEGFYEYDILLYVANWPGSRSSVWKSLLTARAIENQCYVIGVNRIGKDGHGTSHSGNSMIVDPYGKILSVAEEEKPAILQYQLSLQRLNEYRETYPFAPDWDQFTIQI